MAPKNNPIAATPAKPRPDSPPIRKTRTPDYQYLTRPGSPGRVAEPDNLLLEHLKRIQAELSATRERDREIISRLGNIERSVAGLRRDLAQSEEVSAQIGVRLDRLAGRVERIERRLELAG